MCDPLTIAATTMAAGTLYSAYGQYQTGKYNAAVAETNAELAELSAQDAEKRGTAEAARYRTNIRSLQGRQRAAIGGANIERSGSALDILTDTAATAELDMATIRSNAAREAFGFRTQGLNYRAQGQLDRFAGRTQAIGTILGGSSRTASMFMGG